MRCLFLPVNQTHWLIAKLSGDLHVGSVITKISNTIIIIIIIIIITISTIQKIQFLLSIITLSHMYSYIKAKFLAPKNGEKMDNQLTIGHENMVRFVNPAVS